MKNLILLFSCLNCYFNTFSQCTDTEPPTASNPVAVNVECIGDVPAPDPLVVTDEADNEGVPTVTWESDVSDWNYCPETITRTYSITDDCGNQTLVTQTITVNDVTAPTASNPATTTVPGGPAPAVNVTVVTDEADNCSMPYVDFVSESTDGATCPETIIRIYSVTDTCGNTIYVTHTILITDPFPPTASNPVAVNVECIGDVPAPDPLVVTDEADNEGVPTVTWESDASDGFTCPETITRTYSITDDCGNQTLVTQSIIVNDVTPPTASNPDTTFVATAVDVPAPNILAVIDEVDNCTTAPFVTWVSDVSDANNCPEIMTRTCSITDDCGNMTFVYHTIYIGAHAEINAGLDSNGTFLMATLSGASYEWHHCDGSGAIAGANQQTFYPESNGEYMLFVTADGCVDSTDCYILDNLSLNETLLNKPRMVIYPNPANQNINISGLYLKGNMNIYNPLGELVFNGVVDHDLHLDISTLSEGLYFVEITQENGIVYTEKLSVKR